MTATTTTNCLIKLDLKKSVYLEAVGKKLES